jgi:hypothetical protein
MLLLNFKRVTNFKMAVIKLPNDFSFTIEHDEKRVRLIVYKSGVENVCRKESIKKIRQFIVSDKGRMFKGRLQLIKTPAGIAVEVKGKIEGVIRVEDFTGCLESSL